jgi:ssDNA-binding Zn-finger/Zn-ribbon topoisomerase 1
MKPKKKKMIKRLPNSCPDCGADMVLKESKYGLFYSCVEFPFCKATHGAHANGEPLGTPANKETKEWRIKAHKLFDQLWKGKNPYFKGRWRRSQSYRFLRECMGMTADQAHIGNFNIETCKMLIYQLNMLFYGEEK